MLFNVQIGCGFFRVFSASGRFYSETEGLDHFVRTNQPTPGVGRPESLMEGQPFDSTAVILRDGWVRAGP